MYHEFKITQNSPIACVSANKFSSLQSGGGRRERELQERRDEGRWKMITERERGTGRQKGEGREKKGLIPLPSNL
jgi:hypothetical protein